MRKELIDNTIKQQMDMAMQHFKAKNGQIDARTTLATNGPMKANALAKTPTAHLRTMITKKACSKAKVAKDEEAKEKAKREAKEASGGKPRQAAALKVKGHARATAPRKGKARANPLIRSLRINRRQDSQRTVRTRMPRYARIG